VAVGVCYTAVDAAAGAAGGLTTGWWAVVLECFSSHPLIDMFVIYMIILVQASARGVCAGPYVGVKQSTGHTHTGHTDRENTPDTGTHLTRTQSEQRHNDA